MSDLNNASRPPVARLGGAHECLVCLGGRRGEGDVSVVFPYHPVTVICKGCLEAANAAMRNPQPVA